MRSINWLTTISNRIRNASRRRRATRKLTGNRFTRVAGQVQSEDVRAQPEGEFRESLWHSFDVTPRFTRDSRRFQRQMWNTSELAATPELLEDRTLLAATVDIVAGDLVVEDSIGTVADDWSFTADGTTLTITDLSGNPIDLLDELDGDAGDGTASVTILLSEFTGTLDINTLGGDDVVTLGSLKLENNQSVDVDGGTDRDGANITGNVETTGTGSVTVSTSSRISVKSGSSITTVNGGISLSGNFATSTTGFFNGIDVDAATISTSGSGAISLSGKAGTSGDGVGVQIQNASTVQSTATSSGGGITINGIGGGANAGGYGVQIKDVSTLVDSKSGAIQITGQGGAQASSHGVFLTGGADITSSDGTGAATITISANGGTGSSSAGLIITDVGSTISSIAGAIDITGTGASANDSGVVVSDGTIENPGAATVTVSGSAVNGDAIVLQNAAQIGDATGSGTITLKGDEFTASGTTVIDGQGALVIEPVTASTTIGLGDGSGTLNLLDSELAFLSDGFSSITIGKSDAGNIDINTATFRDDVTLLTAAEIIDNAGADLNMVNGDTVTADGTVAPGQTSTPGILNATGNFAFANSSTFEVEIGGTSPGTAITNHDQLDATGSVSIGTGVTLSLVEFNSFGGSVSVGDSFRIINRTGGSGTFNGLAEGAEVSADFFGSGFSAEITYAGGDGDDVVITVGATLVAVSGGTLTVSDSAGQANTFSITLINGGTDIQIRDTANPIFAGTGAAQVDTMTVTVPVAGITGININGGDQADSLEVNYSGGDPTNGLGLTWDGSNPTVAPGDSLTFNLGTGSTTFTNAIYTFDNLNDGSVSLDGVVFNYRDLEPVTSNITATNVTLNYSAAAETITISNAGGGQTTVTSTAGEVVTFNDPTGTLQINAGDTGVNTINVGALTNPYPANIDINGGDGGDSVDLQGSITFAADRSLTIDAKRIDNIANTPVITTSGTGSIALTATQSILLRAGAVLNTVNGGVTLSGNAAGTSTDLFSGVDLAGAIVTSTGSGAIGLTGRSGTGGPLYGVHLRTSAQVTSTSASGGGGITINGTSNSSADDSYGVFVADTNTLIDSKSGAIQITAVGGTGDSSHGLFLNASARITTTGGAAPITLIATGGDNDNSAGLVINGAASTISTVTGPISITATANAARVGGAGVSTRGGTITSTDGGTITITADGNGTTEAFELDDQIIGSAAAGLLAGTGTITLTGDQLTITQTSGTSAISGAGALIIQPQTAGTTIEIGDETGAGILNLSDSELGFLTDGFSSITIGKADAGNVEINTAIFNDPVTILTGGIIRDELGSPDLTLPAGVTATLSGTVAPGQLVAGPTEHPGILNVTTGNSAFADNSTFEVQIGGTTPGVGNGFHDQLDADGSVTIGSNVMLTLSAFLNTGGTINFVPSLGDTFEIISRTGGGGTFAGLAEGALISTNFLGSGQRAGITYTGGDGDDVVIRMLPPDVNVDAGGNLVVNNEAGDINTFIITLINGGATIQIQDTTSLIFAGMGATQCRSGNGNVAC